MISPTSSKFRLVFIGILLLAFGLRMAGMILWQSQADGEKTVFRFGDSDTYWTLASRIAKGEAYEYGSKDAKIFRAPLYPIFLAPFTTFENQRTGVIAARFAGLLLGVFCVWLVMKSAQSLGGNRAAIWAGLCAACYPGAIGMSVVVLSEAIFCPLMMAAIWTLSWGEEKKKKWAWFASGLLSGLACLARPSWFLWPAGMLALAIAFSSKRFENCLKVAWMSLGLALAMSPWWVRNYLETQRFVPTTLQVGASLYDGWHPGASGASDENMDFVQPFAIEQRRLDAIGVEPNSSTFEYRLDRRIQAAAISWARGNPSDVARLALVKLWKTWSPLPTATQVGGSGIRYSEAIGYLIIMVAGLFGCWLVRSEGWRASVFAIPSLYFAILHMIFIGSVRYRQPAILALAVLAGVGLAKFFEEWKKRPKPNLPK